MSGSKLSNKQIKKNIIYSISAQIVSLAVAFVVNLFVPKFIDTYQYGLWQTFALYSSYVGILHFGLLDGMMLRYSQYDYEDIDKSKISSQFIFLMLILSFFAFTLGGISFFMDQITSQILALVAMSLLSKNFFTYVSYTFQLTNRIHLYTRLIILHRIIYLVAIVSLLVSSYKGFILICEAEIAAELFTALICSVWNKGMYFTKTNSLALVFYELKQNISSGSLLLIANWASMLIMGSARMIIQWRWDVATFALFSFAISVTNLFLTFITSISVVFFPSLKRINQETLPKLYFNIRDKMSLLLLWCLLFYFPITYILKIWLPTYDVSLKYLGLMLPMIIYTSKVTLLTNNYLKVLRREKNILRVNIVTLSTAMICFFISAYVFSSVIMVIISVVASCMLKTALSEREVRLNEETPILLYDYIGEGLLIITFVVVTQYLNLQYGFFIYLACILIYSKYFIVKHKATFYNGKLMEN